ncbi:hypothetical protein LUZ60_014573 [Juncus effusus]|nr:hypothetical protein LUZ60_014573 [Juncus effusus]
MASSSGGLARAGTLRPPVRRLNRTQTLGNLGESVLDSEVVPSSLVDIAPILRVANEVEAANPRVAYLCRFYAFEKAHRLDPTSSGRGVRQFKTALLQRLEKENEPTLQGRAQKSDAREMKNFYQQYYKKYIQALQTAGDKADRHQITKAYQTANVLFEVLRAVNLQNLQKGDEMDQETLETEKQIKEKTEIYAHYNILPLYPDSANEAIMQFPEIQAAVNALRNMRGLPWPKDHKPKINEDILDWLQKMFGFQKDNVANQRENLILLLANVHIRNIQRPEQQLRLDERALDLVMKKLFKNYKKWCKFLGRKSSLWMPNIQQEVQQRKLLYMGLYLLIWGEAANLRFMPECICYIYHHMAFELYGMLIGTVSALTGEYVKPAYGGDKEAFLNKVVTPIYDVISEEAAKSKREKAKHSQWRNYDDLNEYFWSIDCFRLGWPMRADADFFAQPAGFHDETNRALHGNRRRNENWPGKVNFVEIRSFWHIFRSFDRMWSFLILALQIMIILGWNGGALIDLFDPDVLKKILSIFITSSVLNLGQSILHLVLNWKARQSMTFVVKLRYLLKVVTAIAWVIILPVTYAYTLQNPTGFAKTIKGWFGNGQSHPSLYIVAVLIYMSPHMLSAVLFVFPLIRRWIESSDIGLISFMMWWSQPRLYVGRGMHEGPFSLFMYTLFWVALLVAKMAFSYYIEIKPLVSPTQAIMKVPITTYQWHEFFPHAKNNIGVIIALWGPIILVYFMDAQIWYAIFSTIVGGVYGASRRLGEIRTLDMLRARFQSIPSAFNNRLIPVDKSKQKKGIRAYLANKPVEFSEDEKDLIEAKFAQMWNEIITSFRAENLISDKEKELLLVPYVADPALKLTQWPPFLLASKIPIAVDMAKDSNKNEHELKKRLDSDYYMSCAVRECYISFKSIITELVQGELEKKVINTIFEQIDSHIENGTLISNLNMEALPDLYKQFVELVNFLKENKMEDREGVIYLFQTMLEVVTTDIMEEELPSLLDPGNGGGSYGKKDTVDREPLFYPPDAVRFPIKKTESWDAWIEKIRRLSLLLTETESAMGVPTNLEARRRITFFTNSLFMDMPDAPKVRNMLSFSVLTPYFNEDVLLHDLEAENDDGVSILFYLQKIFPDEWKNFRERFGFKTDEEFRERIDQEVEEELCLWASYRGQTLTRTVRGMMYYKKALELQAFLDMAKDEDLMKGYKAAELMSSENSKSQRSLSAQCRAMADMKFSYVVSCQQYGIQKRSRDLRATDILNLMIKYPSLRVAYIDEVELPGKEKKKEYYSTLVKASLTKAENSEEEVPLDQVIYRIKLPGNAILGEGKPENQNHAIIFTRGECLQTIDMNQDNYLEEALKMRNLLQEFTKKRSKRYPTILGLREHIFTGSVSSLAWFMSNQESSFVTIGQRVLADPLKVRFHYGHPDVFDRLFHITRGGISKASKTINLSEDIFAGFNSTLRQGNVTHHEYMQVGKGRDVGLNQISQFEAKVANGNGEQTLSRDIYRLGHRFDFFRMLSCYFTTIGFYFSNMLTVLTVYVFLYGRLYLVLSGLEEGLITDKKFSHNTSLQVSLASQSFIQLGFLMALPMLMEIGLEKGFGNALSEFLLMQLQLASVFFAFSLGTKTHYYGRTLLHGGAQYRGTGRGFVVFHAKFADNYRLYSRSHFVKGLELLILLVIYQIFGQSYRSTLAYILITFSMWFMVFTWLFSPFLFNPSGFEWQKIAEDWSDWNKWINNRGGIGVSAEKSWESWWESEHEHLRYSGIRGILAEIVLSLRFFIYQYGLVYHLSITKKTQSVLVYGVSLLILLVVLFAVKIVSFGRRRLGAQVQLVFRLIKFIIFVTIISIVITLFLVLHITVLDIFITFLAFMPTGWGILQIAQACKPLVKRAGLWSWIRSLARGYEIVIGVILYAPITILAWFPFVSEFQTRMLFNQAFSRGLQISRILGGQRRDRVSRAKD